METSKTQISRDAAVNNLKLFFANKPDADHVSPSEVLVAVGREQKTAVQNKSWLSNKLSSMRTYGLFERKYEKTKSGGMKLVKIVLTDEGRKALKRDKRKQPSLLPPYSPPQDHNSDNVGLETLETINHLIMLVKQKMPNWELKLTDNGVVFHPKEKS